MTLLHQLLDVSAASISRQRQGSPVKAVQLRSNRLVEEQEDPDRRRQPQRGRRPAGLIHRRGRHHRNAAVLYLRRRHLLIQQPFRKRKKINERGPLFI